MTTPPLDDRLPLIVLAQTDPASVIDIYERSAALQIAIVDRLAINNLSQEWDETGVYILLDRHLPDGTWGAYVGKATTGIRLRLKAHVNTKDHWYRAILLTRDTTHGFNSAHAAWLEGRIFDLLRASKSTKLHNLKLPGDDTLDSYDIPMLESVVEPIAQLLRLVGHDVSTADDIDTMKSDGLKNVFHGVALKDLILAGFLNGNEELVSTMSTVPALAQIQPDGRIKFNGEFFTTPSAAAVAARGGATNGWSMWAIVTPTGQVRLSTLRANYQDFIKASH